MSFSDILNLDGALAIAFCEFKNSPDGILAFLRNHRLTPLNSAGIFLWTKAKWRQAFDPKKNLFADYEYRHIGKSIRLFFYEPALLGIQRNPFMDFYVVISAEIFEIGNREEADVWSIIPFMP